MLLPALLALLLVPSLLAARLLAESLLPAGSTLLLVTPSGLLARLRLAGPPALPFLLAPFASLFLPAPLSVS